MVGRIALFYFFVKYRETSNSSVACLESRAERVPKCDDVGSATSEAATGVRPSKRAPLAMECDF